MANPKELQAFEVRLASRPKKRKFDRKKLDGKVRAIMKLLKIKRDEADILVSKLGGPTHPNKVAFDQLFPGERKFTFTCLDFDEKDAKGVSEEDRERYFKLCDLLSEVEDIVG